MSKEVLPAVPAVSWHFQGALSLSLSVFTPDRISQLRVLFLLLFRPWHLPAVAAVLGRQEGSRDGRKAGILSWLGLDLPFHLTLSLRKEKNLILDEQEVAREIFFLAFL